MIFFKKFPSPIVLCRYIVKKLTFVSSRSFCHPTVVDFLVFPSYTIISSSLVAQRVKVSAYNGGDWVQSWVRKILWRRKWQPTPVFLPGNSHGQRSLVGLQSMGSQRVRNGWATSLTHSPVNKNNFIHSFLMWTPFTYFPCLNALPRISNINILNFDQNI